MPLLDEYVEHARSSQKQIRLLARYLPWVVSHLAYYIVQASTHPSLSGLWDWLDTENQNFYCRPHLANLVASPVKALLCGVPFFIAFVFTVPLRIILKIVDCFEVASMDGVDIVLVRHGQAVSNVNSGEWRPDGLTDFGIKRVHEFTQHTKLQNVHAIVSSCSTRSIQTAQILAKAFADLPKIYCRPELQELTPWPYDQPINLQQSEGRLYTYTKLRGGGEEDAGTLTRDQVVDMNNLDWPVMPHTFDLFPSREELQNRVIQARIWLRGLAKEVLMDYPRNNIHGRPTIVVVCHGGFLNLFLGEYRCWFTRSPSSESWQWASSTTLNNLDAVVCSFASLTNQHAQLVEREKSEEWSKVLGQHYRHLGSDPKCGGDVNHEREYWLFWDKAAEEVRHQDKTLLNRLLLHQGWRLITSTARWTLESLA